MKKKIFYIILVCIIIAGAVIIGTQGLEVDIVYSKNVRIDIYLGKTFENNDIRQIAQEVFETDRVLIQQVELYGDMVSITVKEENAQNIDEKLEKLNTKINEKYELENKVDNLTVTHQPKVRLSSIISPYIWPFAISAIIIGAFIGFVTTAIKDYVNDGKLFNGDISGWEYFGSILGGAVGGLGGGLGTTILASGVGNIIEAAFVGDISSFGDVMTQFALGGLLGGVGYGISKGITSIFADKKIFGILGNLNDNLKVNKRLAKAGFGNLKIGKHGLYAVYNKMYDTYGFDKMKDAISSVYDFVIGLAF